MGFVSSEVTLGSSTCWPRPQGQNQAAGVLLARPGHVCSRSRRVHSEAGTALREGHGASGPVCKDRSQGVGRESHSRGNQKSKAKRRKAPLNAYQGGFHRSCRSHMQGTEPWKSEHWTKGKVTWWEGSRSWEGDSEDGASSWLPGSCIYKPGGQCVNVLTNIWELQKP